MFLGVKAKRIHQKLKKKQNEGANHATFYGNKTRKAKTSLQNGGKK
jgi:hypothetical protein